MSADRRALRFLAIVFVIAGVAGCDRFTGPSPIEGGWRVHETAQFALHVRPGSFADRHVATFGDVLEDQLVFAQATLDGRYEGRLLGFFYDFAGQGGMEGSREGVAYPLTQTFKLVASPPLDDSLFALMSHEANHVIVRHLLGRPGTSFMNEGLASALLSERFHDQGPSFAHRWSAQASGLPPLRDLADDDKWSGMDFNRKYNASASFVAFLLDTYGPAPFGRLYGASSGQFGARFRELYGMELDQAEAQWRAFLDSVR